MHSFVPNQCQVCWFNCLHFPIMPWIFLPLNSSHHYGHPRIYHPHWSLSPFAAEQLCGIFYFCLPHRYSPIQKNAECSSSSRQIQIQVSWSDLGLFIAGIGRSKWSLYVKLCDSMAATEQIRIWHTPSPSFLGGFAAVCGACRDPCLDKVGRIWSYYCSDIRLKYAKDRLIPCCWNRVKSAWDWPSGTLL